MQLWHFIITQFSSNNFLNAAVIGGFLAGVVLSLKKIPRIVFNYCLGKIMTSVTVDSKNELFYWLNNVVEELPFHKHRYAFYIFGQKRDYDKSEDVQNKAIMLHSNKPDIKEIEIENKRKESKRFLEYIYSPAEGHYIFRYKKRWLFIYFERETKNSGSPLFTLRISYFGRSKQFFDSIMNEAEDRYKKFYREQVILVMNDSWGSWMSHGSKTLLSKPIESVVLPDGKMQAIIDDIRTFQNSEQKYVELGIPYHRTYLFHGIPGTGKTSTIYALANHFNMALFYLNLQTTSDEYINVLFTNVNPNSILVIEDIGNIYNKEDFVQKRNSERAVPPSYNVFINCLDGFLSKHGALTILTTNHYDRLGNSLLRPGRIDKQIRFDACDRYQLYTICYRYYLYMKLSKDESHQRAFGMQNLFEDRHITPASLQKMLLDSDSNLDQKDYFEHIKANYIGEPNGN